MTYIVTKFVKSGDLLSYMEKLGVDRLPEAMARVFIKQIAIAVATYHAEGVAHRDLKHLNILVSMKGTSPKVKITDFGMAARLKAGQTITKMAGTISFMSPEIVLEKPSDFKTDIWSLGVILYALICSRAPFCAAEREEMVRQITSEEVDFSDSVWSTVTDSCKDLIHQMLDKDQKKRISV